MKRQAADEVASQEQMRVHDSNRGSDLAPNPKAEHQDQEDSPNRNSTIVNNKINSSGTKELDQFCSMNSKQQQEATTTSQLLEIPTETPKAEKQTTTQLTPKVTAAQPPSERGAKKAPSSQTTMSNYSVSRMDEDEGSLQVRARPHGNLNPLLVSHASHSESQSQSGTRAVP